MLRLRWCSRVFSSGGARLLAEVAPLTAEHRLRQLQVPGSTAQPQQLWCTGLVAPQHVGSSQTWDGTHVPCIGRWILNHWTIREVPDLGLNSSVHAQACPTLCNLLDCSPPGASVLRVFQTRILEWVAISHSRMHCLCAVWFWTSSVPSLKPTSFICTCGQYARCKDGVRCSADEVPGP